MSAILTGRGSGFLSSVCSFGFLFLFAQIREGIFRDAGEGIKIQLRLFVPFEVEQG
jgi:hypothetical protein